MEEESLLALFMDAKDNKSPLRIVLLSGTQIEFVVHSVGHGWVSGFCPGDGGAGVLLRTAAIGWIEGCATFLGAYPSHHARSHTKRVPLSLMIDNLRSLHSRVVIHGARRVLRGTLVRSGSDFLVLAAQGGAERVVPFTSLEWVEVA